METEETTLDPKLQDFCLSAHRGDLYRLQQWLHHPFVVTYANCNKFYALKAAVLMNHELVVKELMRVPSIYLNLGADNNELLMFAILHRRIEWALELLTYRSVKEHNLFQPLTACIQIDDMGLFTILLNTNKGKKVPPRPLARYVITGNHTNAATVLAGRADYRVALLQLVAELGLPDSNPVVRAIQIATAPSAEEQEAAEMAFLKKVLVRDDTADTCCVCWSDCNTRTKICRHYLCTSCAMAWLVKSTLCPTCRAVIRPTAVGETVANAYNTQ